jgi:hypothetical protein
LKLEIIIKLESTSSKIQLLKKLSNQSLKILTYLAEIDKKNFSLSFIRKREITEERVL